MRSPRAVLIEQFRALTNREGRYVDMAAQLRVVRRSPTGDSHYPAELLPAVYGGRWDTWAKSYVRGGSVTELLCHPGQIDLLTYDGPADRIVSLGPPGGGKTQGNVNRAILCMLEYPGRPGGVVAPVSDKKGIAWNKMVATLGVLGWLKAANPASRLKPAEIHATNGAYAQFVSAQRASRKAVSPIAGFDWWWAVEDEQQGMDDEATREVDYRGRVNPGYKVFSAAVNEPNVSFQRRLQGYRDDKQRTKVIPYSLYDNSFVTLERIDALQSRTPQDVWERMILCLERPVDGRAFPMFSYQENVRPSPTVATDITASLTSRWEQGGFSWILATDYGSLTNATAVLKAFRDPGTRDGVLWWVMDEIVTHGTTADTHFLAVKRKGYQPGECIVIADPYNSDKQDDKSDYVLTRRAGFKAVPANHETIRPRKKRYTMMNGLLLSANGKRRLFVNMDPHTRKERAPMVVESLQNLMLLPSGEPDENNKSIRDLTHYTDGVSYGLFPFEKILGEIGFIRTGTAG